ncbi:MAG: hypothetical protein II842_01860 [Butyrivibrio sp.]|nr:hypothetical protein [Butyrivibrio sp.]
MNQADIFVTEPAEHDIDEIEYYIGVNLCNKSAAENTVDGIISEISELGNYPLKHPPSQTPFSSQKMNSEEMPSLSWLSFISARILSIASVTGKYLPFLG